MDDNCRKLVNEVKNLDLLRQVSMKCCNQTKSMCEILLLFDNRLLKLERTIQPVYKTTGNLQSRQGEITRTLKRLDSVIKYYSVTSEVEAIIVAGPSNRLDRYMECLDRLKEAINYFEHNNPDSPEGDNVLSLYKRGGDAVEREFKQILLRYSMPIAPIALLDMINDDVSEQQLDSTNSGTSNASSTSSVQVTNKRAPPDIPQETIEKLKIMCEWLCTNRDDDFFAGYVEPRSELVSKSLESLQNYQKSRSATYATRGGVDSPEMSARKRMTISGSSGLSRESNATTKRTPKSIQMAFKRKLHNVIPGEVLSSKFYDPQQSSANVLDDTSISEREIVSYLTCITALHKLVMNELNLMSSIIPLDYRTPIFDRLIQPALRLIVNEATSLSMRVKKSISRHDFKSSLNLFPILRHQTLRRHNFDLLFEGCQSSVLTKFQGLIVIFRTTINISLEEFVDFVKNDIDMKVPDDGTVHELTNNVMIFIVQLYDHLDILYDVITVTDSKSMGYYTDKNKLAFAQYILRLLSALGLTLKKKSEQSYTNIFLRAIFELNNHHYILKTLKESSLLNIVHIYNDETSAFYEGLIKDERKIYLASWNQALDYITEPQDARGKSIKERFSGFNKEFQELHKTQSSYAIPDADLRLGIRKEIKDYLVPKYRNFYERYRRSDFTKNKDKYIKYTPEQVASMIEEFFEAA